ncbi:hypothetical protein [Azospirillum rugosum]|uniref:Uncharacterized protein n=1 Tax=Azospirillum rugosum TaxID=416170 RepID=A0ABS4SJX4_9PROT|nr:hypothetical protein [Azospirillum rugosum]MBP2292805.1 hypothetical protein [Azospirillum rugosum]MDQ0527064.1 hypothetical protein [Azospirillum rugosum]
MQDDVFTFYDRHTPDTRSEQPEAPQLLIGTESSDRLVGGPAGDALVAGQDRLEFDDAGGLRYGDARIRAQDGGTAVDIGGHRIEMPGVQPNQLSSRDFIF